jgi:hypothetical protein
MGYYIDINKGHDMTIWIDPTFASYLPLLGYLTACYVGAMVGKGMAARRTRKQATKG